MSERNLLTPFHATLVKESGGGLYQPSNGEEGGMFQALWCEDCVHDAAFRQHGAGGCKILSKTMFLRPSDPDYPPEWNYSTEGQPQCTAFEAIPF